MKPLRGKREGPSGRRHAFSWTLCRAGFVFADASAPRPIRLAHSFSALAFGADHDRFADGQSRCVKVAFAIAEVLQHVAAATRQWIEERDAARLRAGALVRLGLSVARTVCSACVRPAAVSGACRGCAPGLWSCRPPSRPVLKHGPRSLT